MQLINYLQEKLPMLAVLSLALGLTSCGSYQYVGQNSDGIYGEDNEQQVQVAQEKQQETTGNDYYKNYFKEKALEMESSNENEVFVDIDSYQGNYSDESTQTNSYGAWGENGSEVTVNVYDNGWGFYNNWNSPWGWNRWGWNRGFNRWNAGFGYGYGGFGWNAGFYDPFWCPPFYGSGYGYGYPYYGSGFYNRNRRGLAYNSTRRGNLYRNNSLLGRRINANRSRRHSTSTRTRTSTRPRVRTTNPRVRPTTPRTRPSRPRATTPRTRQSTPRTVRPSRSTPRTNRSYSPSRSSTRSSGSSSRGSSRRRG